MTPATADITFVKGDDFSQTYQLSTASAITTLKPNTVISGNTVIGGVTFTPLDLTTASVAAQIRRTVSTTSTSVETLLASFSITLDDAVNGIFTLSLPHTTTANITINENASDAYDVQVTNGNVVTTYISGSVSVVQDVTR